MKRFLLTHRLMSTARGYLLLPRPKFQLGSRWGARAAQGPGTCDHTAAERAANLVTCLPFFKIGLDTYRCAAASRLTCPPPAPVQMK
jgi:hypothetical protein